MKKVYFVLMFIVISACSNDDEDCGCREFNYLDGGTFLAFSCSDDIQSLDEDTFDEALERCSQF
ncbi:hypothetical protein [Aquimarina rubra]|uniref:Uncharacterized protein n=1 Tax=Aquimarina rubra TaxID=1920033 RepID=A0ABW5LN67_9FLAO